MPLKSCAYCGRIHPKGYDCGKLPKPYGRKKGTDEQKFRSTNAWRKKSMQVRQRDKFMCLYCRMRENRIRTEQIEVHHIVPVAEDWNKRMDEDNLVSLCREHHEAAEKGLIERDMLIDMASEAEAEHDGEMIVC